MSDRTQISTADAPSPLLAYAQGVRRGGLLAVAGQASQDPQTLEILHTGDVHAQTIRTLRNIRAILEAGGATLADVVMVRVYLTRREHLGAMDAAYRQFMTEHLGHGVLPARTTVFVELPLEEMLVEIDALAAAPS